jgi:hypothetical protein
MNQEYHATLGDIAKTLGLSLSTVSRALHDNPSISLARREQIQKAAREMGYPNSQLASAKPEARHGGCFLLRLACRVSIPGPEGRGAGVQNSGVSAPVGRCSRWGSHRLANGFEDYTALLAVLLIAPFQVRDQMA